MYKSWMWQQRSYREQFQGDEGGASAGGAAASEQLDDELPEDGQHLPEGETPEDAQPAAAEKQPEEDGDEVVITIGDEPPPVNDDEVDGKAAPQWVKDLRKQARDLARENRELKQAQQAAQLPAAAAATTVGERPTLESCDFDGDVYADKLLAWNEAKRKADEIAAAARQEEEAAHAAWAQKLTAYKTAGAALRVADFADAEAAAQEVFSPTQLGIIVNGADNAAQLVYALGSNPAKAKELAAIKDPVKYAFAVAKLETQLKVTPRKTAPQPERNIRGSSSVPVSNSGELDKLRAEADRTGDRSKVIRYLREKNARQA